MKVFYRTSLPDLINYNGKTYVYSVEKMIDSIQVNVLSRNLKCKTDLYGREYSPTKHYFKPSK